MNSNSIDNSDLNNRISFEKLNVAETMSRNQSNEQSDTLYKKKQSYYIENSHGNELAGITNQQKKREFLIKVLRSSQNLNDIRLQNNISNLLEISDLNQVDDENITSSIVLNTGASQINLNDLKNFIDTFYDENIANAQDQETQINMDKIVSGQFQVLKVKDYKYKPIDDLFNADINIQEQLKKHQNIQNSHEKRINQKSRLLIMQQKRFKKNKQYKNKDNTNLTLNFKNVEKINIHDRTKFDNVDLYSQISQTNRNRNCASQIESERFSNKQVEQEQNKNFFDNYNDLSKSLIYNTIKLKDNIDGSQNIFESQQNILPQDLKVQKSMEKKTTSKISIINNDEFIGQPIQKILNIEFKEPEIYKNRSAEKYPNLNLRETMQMQEKKIQNQYDYLSYVHDGFMGSKRLSTNMNIKINQTKLKSVAESSSQNVKENVKDDINYTPIQKFQKHLHRIELLDNIIQKKMVGSGMYQIKNNNSASQIDLMIFAQHHLQQQKTDERLKKQFGAQKPIKNKQNDNIIRNESQQQLSSFESIGKQKEFKYLSFKNIPNEQNDKNNRYAIVSKIDINHYSQIFDKLKQKNFSKKNLEGLQIQILTHNERQFKNEKQKKYTKKISEKVKNNFDILKNMQSSIQLKDKETINIGSESDIEINQKQMNITNIIEKSVEKINASSQVINDENNQIFEKTGGFSQYSFHEKVDKNLVNIVKQDEQKYILKNNNLKVLQENSPYFFSNLQSSKYQKFNVKNDGQSNVSLSSFQPQQLKPLMNSKMISDTLDEIFQNEKSVNFKKNADPISQYIKSFSTSPQNIQHHQQPSKNQQIQNKKHDFQKCKKKFENNLVPTSSLNYQNVKSANTSLMEALISKMSANEQIKLKKQNQMRTSRNSIASQNIWDSAVAYISPPLKNIPFEIGKDDQTQNYQTQNLISSRLVPDHPNGKSQNQFQMTLKKKYLEDQNIIANFKHQQKKRRSPIEIYYQQEQMNVFNQKINIISPKTFNQKRQQQNQNDYIENFNIKQNSKKTDEGQTTSQDSDHFMKTQEERKYIYENLNESSCSENQQIRIQQLNQSTKALRNSNIMPFQNLKQMKIQKLKISHLDSQRTVGNLKSDESKLKQNVQFPPINQNMKLFEQIQLEDVEKTKERENKIIEQIQNGKKYIEELKQLARKRRRNKIETLGGNTKIHSQIDIKNLVQFSKIGSSESPMIQKHFSTISDHNINEQTNSQKAINLQESNSLTAIQQSQSENELSYNMKSRDLNDKLPENDQLNKQFKASAIQASQNDIDSSFNWNQSSRFQLPKVSSLASALKNIQLQFQGEIDSSENLNQFKRINGQKRKMESKNKDVKLINKKIGDKTIQSKQNFLNQNEENQNLPDILKNSKNVQNERNQIKITEINRKNSLNEQNILAKSSVSLQKQTKYEQQQTRTSSLYKISTHSQTHDQKEEDIIQKQQQDNIQFLNHIVQNHKLSVKVNRRNQTKSYDRFKFYQVQTQKQKISDSQGYTLDNQNQFKQNQPSFQEDHQKQIDHQIQLNQSNQSLFTRQPNQIFSFDALARDYLEVNRSSLTILQNNLDFNKYKQDNKNSKKIIGFSNTYDSRQILLTDSRRNLIPRQLSKIMNIKNVNPEKTYIEDIIQERFECNLSSISNKLKIKLDMRANETTIEDNKMNELKFQIHQMIQNNSLSEMQQQMLSPQKKIEFLQKQSMKKIHLNALDKQMLINQHYQRYNPISKLIISNSTTQNPFKIGKLLFHQFIFVKGVQIPRETKHSNQMRKKMNSHGKVSQRSNQDDGVDNETELQSSLIAGHKWDSSLKKSQNDFELKNASEQFLLLQNEIGQQSIESSSVINSPINLAKVAKKEKNQAIKKLKKQQRKFIIQDN